MRQLAAFLNIRQQKIHYQLPQRIEWLLQLPNGCSRTPLQRKNRKEWLASFLKRET